MLPYFFCSLNRKYQIWQLFLNQRRSNWNLHRQVNLVHQNINLTGTKTVNTDTKIRYFTGLAINVCSGWTPRYLVSSIADAHWQNKWLDLADKKLTSFDLSRPLWADIWRILSYVFHYRLLNMSVHWILGFKRSLYISSWLIILS